MEAEKELLLQESQKSARKYAKHFLTSIRYETYT